MTREDFEQPGPMLTDPQYGPEPSLKEVLEHYYTSHDIPLDMARELTEFYIGAVVDE